MSGHESRVVEILRNIWDIIWPKGRFPQTRDEWAAWNKGTGTRTEKRNNLR